MSNIGEGMHFMVLIKLGLSYKYLLDLIHAIFGSALGVLRVGIQ